jgi:hypothetical protein
LVPEQTVDYFVEAHFIADFITKSDLKALNLANQK